MERSVRCYAERKCPKVDARDAPWMPSSPPSPPVAARRSLLSTMARYRVRWRASGDSHARLHSASPARTSSKKCPRKVACMSFPFRNRRRRFDFHRESADQTDSTTLTISTDSADSSPFKPKLETSGCAAPPGRDRSDRAKSACVATAPPSLSDAALSPDPRSNVSFQLARSSFHDGRQEQQARRVQGDRRQGHRGRYPRRDPR